MTRRVTPARVLARNAGILLLAGWLAACASSNSSGDADSTTRGLISSFADRFKGRNAPAAPTAPDLGLTRAALAKLDRAVDLVTVERVNAQGAIFMVGQNNGIETWSSVDNRTLALRDGIVIETRGLGSDLQSSSAPRLSAIAAGQGHTRQMVHLSGDDKPIRDSYSCTVSDLGPETLVIVERSYATRHLRETCSGESGSFSNDFWLQGGGKLRQSRQWIGREVEYVLIKHLSG